MTQSYHETTKKTCSFPAIELRAYLHELRAELDRLFDAGEKLSSASPRFNAIAESIRGILKLRCDHEDVDGCICWYTPDELSRNRAHDKYVEQWRERAAERAVN